MTEIFSFGAHSPAVLFVPLLGLVTAVVLVRFKSRYVTGGVTSSAPSVDELVDAVRPIEQQQQAEDAALSALVFYCSLLAKDLSEVEQKSSENQKEAEKLADKTNGVMEALETQWLAFCSAIHAHYRRDSSEPTSWATMRETESYVKALPALVQEAINLRDERSLAPARANLNNLRTALKTIRAELGGRTASGSLAKPAPVPDAVKSWNSN